MGETNFRTREFPRSGSKAEDGEKKREKRGKKDRTMVIRMGKLRMAHKSTHGARKPPGPIWDPKKLAIGLKKIRSRKKFGGQKNSDTKAIWSQRKFPSIS